MLWNVAAREDDLVGLGAVLHALPTGRHEPSRALMLARAYAELGDPRRAVGVLEALPPKARSDAPVIEQLEGYRARLKAAGASDPLHLSLQPRRLPHGTSCWASWNRSDSIEEARAK
jgi:hypothetical protein